MKTLNEVNLIGNVGTEPTVKILGDTKNKVIFSLATSVKYKNQSGAEVEKTTWHNIACYSKLQNTILSIVKKGSKLFIKGELNYTPYEKNGVKCIYTEIVLEDFILMDKKEVQEQ
jgi:single-strand DNA-binding protein